MVQLLWKIAWQLLKTLNIELLYDPAIPCLCVYILENRKHISTKRFVKTLKWSSPDRWTSSIPILIHERNEY